MCVPSDKYDLELIQTCSPHRVCVCVDFRIKWHKQMWRREHMNISGFRAS